MTDTLRNSNTPTRLAKYRARAADSRNQYPDAKNWRYWKQSISAVPDNVRGPEGQIYSETLNQYGTPCDIPRGWLDHNGWYADSFYDALIMPAVCRMRCPRGTLYIPVISHTEWDGTTHYVADAVRVPKGATEDAHEDAMRQALYAADSLAESYAEECREDDAKNQAESQIEDAREAIATARKEAHAIIVELRTVTLPAALCGIARDKLRVLRQDVRHAVKQIRALESNYWLSVE